jgi:hypothetical protein
MTPNNFLDITGVKYGKLTVLSKSAERASDGSVKWVCQCECGKETVVAGTNLRRGKTTSCGCLIGAHLRQKRPTGRVMGNVWCDVVDLDDVHDLVKG